ncbi:MAG: class I SAM-dependent methyltransferase [Thermodesulfobacteriota bacterium]
MQRIAEPELMEGVEQAKVYAEADFSPANKQFLDLFHTTFPDFSGRATVLDLGCGPGHILFDFARIFPGCTCLGLDGSEEMLNHAYLACGSTTSSSIAFQCKQLPFPDDIGTWQVILSNSLLHHLNNPADLWQSVKKLAEPGTLIFVMDLFRPGSPEDAKAIVEKYSSDEPEILQQDFYNSLLAAYRPGEVALQLAEQDLNLQCREVSDRHLAIWGQLTE